MNLFVVVDYDCFRNSMHHLWPSSFSIGVTEKQRKADFPANECFCQLVDGEGCVERYTLDHPTLPRQHFITTLYEHVFF